MTASKQNAQVHRFGDTVAAWLGDGQTVYLTPKDARALAKALNACARDIKARRFMGCLYTSVLLELTDTGHNGTAFKIERKA